VRSVIISKMNKSFPKPPNTPLQKARELRRNMTESERKLWHSLRDNQLGVRFRRQVPVGHYIVDFLSRKCKLIVELDGSQHYSKKGLIYDSERDDYLQKRGFLVLRFSDRELLTNNQGVRQIIYEHIQNRF